MKHDNIEDRLKAAVDNSVPDILDDRHFRRQQKEKKENTAVFPGSYRRSSSDSPGCGGSFGVWIGRRHANGCG